MLITGFLVCWTFFYGKPPFFFFSFFFFFFKQTHAWAWNENRDRPNTLYWITTPVNADFKETVGDRAACGTENGIREQSSNSDWDSLCSLNERKAWIHNLWHASWRRDGHRQFHCSEWCYKGKLLNFASDDLRGYWKYSYVYFFSFTS